MTDTRELVERIAEAEGHTPGPWGVQDSPNGGMLLLRGLYNEDRMKRHPQTHLQIVPAADARLIALAPEMAAEIVRLTARLAALEADAGRLDTIQGLTNSNVERPRGKHFAPIYRIIDGCLVAVTDIRAAIDAARGEGEKPGTSTDTKAL